jgi:ABC-type nitrate/sulfonate/bicarbonate transport system permease component
VSVAPASPSPSALRRSFAGSSRWLTGLLGIVGVLVVWQAIGAAGWFHGSIPSPTAIVNQMRDDGWRFYRSNLTTTGREALKGWLWGNALAIGLAIAFVQVPFVERTLMRVAIAAYCLPIIAIGPILQILYNGDTPKVILAALLCFFATLIGLLVGLRSADVASLDLVRAYGGGSWLQLRKVRLRASLPSLFSGLRIAAPGAVLGAIIGEYMGGDSGLGVAMISSEQGLHIATTWALALVAAALAGVAYGITAGIGRLLTPWVPRTVT